MRRTWNVRTLAALTGMWCVVGTAQLSAGVIYVDASATGSDDGTSWTDAYNDLQDALTAATSGDEIWVAAGTYKPHNCFDRTATFTLKDGVSLYGGFPQSGGTRNFAKCAGGKFNGMPCFEDDECGKDEEGEDITCEGNKTILSGDLGIPDPNIPCTVENEAVDCACYGGTCIDGFCEYPRIDVECTADANCLGYGDVCVAGICIDTRDDNSLHVVTYDDPGITATLDGFIVTAGQADDAGVPDNQGGAVQIRAPGRCIIFECSDQIQHGCKSNSDCPGGIINTCDFTCSGACIAGGPTLRNCVFQNNYALHHSAVNDHGSSTVIDNCLFRDNEAGQQGAALVIDNGSATVTNSRFENNRTTGSAGEGGAVWIGGRSGVLGCPASPAPQFEGCTFEGNSATKGGAIWSEDSTVTFTGCTFSENAAGNRGSAIWYENASKTESLTLVGCILKDNHAAQSTLMFIASFDELTIIDSKISNNVAAALTHDYYYGTVYAGNGNQVVIDRSEFVGNRDYVFGVMRLDHPDSVISNSTIIGNRFRATGGNAHLGFGSGVHEMRNCSIVYNDVHGGNSEDGYVFKIQAADVMVRNSILFANSLETSTIIGSGSITFDYTLQVDPLFVENPDPGNNGWDGLDDSYGDLRLTAASPAIDYGDPEYEPEVGETDLDGNDRVICAAVDAGAYEFNPECCETADCGSGNVCCDYACEDCCDDGDCGSGELCCDNVCAACCDDGDCTGGDICCDGSCESWECCDDDGCSGGDICCANSCESWECCDDSHCPGLEVCKMSNNTCVECTSNAHCSGGKVCCMEVNVCNFEFLCPL